MMNNPIPPDYQRYDGCTFTDRQGTHYLIEAKESEISQLVYTDKGTCLDPDLPPEFELRVYEVDRSSNYKGLSGQFSAPERIAHYYDVRLNQIQHKAH